MTCCNTDDEHDELNQKPLEGPLENRRCRDLPCLLLYIVFWIGLFIITGIAFSDGEPRRIVYGYDSWGNICGQKNDKVIDSKLSGLDMTGYDYLYIDPSSSSDYRVCVEACPVSTETGCNANPSSAGCQDTGACVAAAAGSAYSGAGAVEGTDYITADKCPDTVYKSEELFGFKRCIPTDASNQFNAVVDLLNEHTAAEDLLSDIVASKTAIGIGVVLAIVASVIIVLLMRCLGKPLIYAMVIAGMLGSLALSVITYTRYKSEDDSIDEKEAAGQTVPDSEKRDRNVLLALTVIAFVLTGLIWIIIIALRNRIRLAVGIFEEASKALRKLPQLFLMPIWTNVFLVGYFAFWLAVYCYMITRGDAVETDKKHAEYQDSEDSNYRKQYWYLILALFWNSQFILAVSQITIAGAVASWYFSRDKELNCTVFSSFWRGIRYNAGSLAFGSLIIAIIQVIRAILYYIKEKTEDKEGFIVKCIVRCCMCCFWCLQKFFEFINKNAYIEIAIRNYSFCAAATRVFKVLGSNLLRVVTLNTVTSVILFVCKLFVIAVSSAFTYYYIRNDDTLNEEVKYKGGVALFVGILAYFLADLFLDIYDMTIDSIFICWAEDCEMNNGKDKPYFMSDNLLKFMNNNAKNTTEVEKLDDQ